MSAPETSGAGLAERQAALVAALVAGGPAPAGFDEARLAATKRALLRKRADGAAKAWTLLAHTLGDRWPATFDRIQAGHEPVGGLREGWRVARVLRADGELPEPAATELAEREAEWIYQDRGEPRRRRYPRLRRFLSRRGRTSAFRPAPGA